MISFKPNENKTEILALALTSKDKKALVYFAAKYNVSLSYLSREILKVFIIQENQNLLEPAQKSIPIQEEIFVNE